MLSSAVRSSAHLLFAVLVGTGAKEIECEDWDTGEMVTLPLDPFKSPVEVRTAKLEGRVNRGVRLKQHHTSRCPRSP